MEWVNLGVRACPTKWFTPIIGLFKLKDKPFAKTTPDIRPPINPGPEVTEIIFISFRELEQNARFNLGFLGSTRAESSREWL